MKDIRIGLAANRKPLVLSSKARKSTHMHVIGGSGTGKSKFLEWLIRRDIRARHGVCLLDWHGTLYRDVVRYCAYMGIGLGDSRSVILLNPSEPTHVTGFNPFMNRGADVSAQVSRRIDATVRPWGVTDTNEMPTFERLCRLLYTFAVEANETLPNAARLLQFDRPALRQYAAARVSDPYIRDQWRQLELVRSARDWRELVLSTENRFGRFLGSKSVTRFMGLREGNLDLLDIMDQGKILLVNLASSDFLDREAARVFASLLLNEFMETAMRRANRRTQEPPPHHALYLDEFQEYMTEDISSMLDQVRKGGLHMVLAHQHLGHLADNPRLKESILTNARIRAVFGGLSYEAAVEMANEMFLPDLNTRQIKKAYYHTAYLYREETRKSYSHAYGRSTGKSDSAGRSRGSGAARGMSSVVTVPGGNAPGASEGWFTESDGSNDTTSEFSASSSSSMSSDSESESQSASEFPVWVPIPIEELTTEAEWTREEKASKVAEMLKMQTQRHCFIRIETEKTQPLQVPFVEEFGMPTEDVAAYEQAVYDIQGAIEASAADTAIDANAQRFVRAAAAFNQDRQHHDELGVIGRE
jgi:hypothetical protein